MGKKNKNRTGSKHGRVTTVRTSDVLPGHRAMDPEFERGMNAYRSFYSNAVAWGTNLLADARDNYSLDDASAAQLYPISVTAWACATYRAEVESGIAPKVVDENDRTVSEEDNPVKWFCDNATRLVYHASLSRMIWGKVYFLKIRNRAGKPTRLHWLNPLDVSPDIDYTQQEFRGFRIRGLDKMVAPEDMIVDVSFDPLNDFDGVSNFEVAMRQVVGDRELVRFAQRYFQSGTMLGGMLTYEGDPSDDELIQLKQEWEQFKGSQNAWKTFIAGGGISKFNFQQMQPNPVDLAMPDLKNVFRVDTCVAFRVNPVLIGAAYAADALSAQNTYQQVHIAFLQDTAIPSAGRHYQTLTEQWLKTDFGDWGSLRILPDRDEIDSASKATTDRSTLALGNVGRFWTIAEARDYTGRPPLPFRTIEIAPDWMLDLYDKGMIRRNFGLRLIGLEPEQGQPDGFTYELDPRAKGNPQSAMSISFPPHNQQMGVDYASKPEPEPAKSLPESSSQVREPSDCFVLLSLANNAALVEIQNNLKEQFPDYEWLSPDEFHLTLITAPGASNFKALQNALPKSINAFTFTASGVGTFDTAAGEPLPVYLSVRPTLSLLALQTGLASTFTAMGLELSPYTENWQPHITMGYAPPGSRLPVWNESVSLQSATIVCSIDKGNEHQTFFITRARSEIVADQLAELDHWRHVVRRRGINAVFEVRNLTSNIADYVRGELAGYWNPAQVFVEAKRAIRAGEPPRLMGATAEEAGEWWRDFDNIQHDIGESFIAYQRSISAETFNKVLEGGLTALDEAMQKHQDELLAAWVGTAANPGKLTQIMLAGMAAGDRALAKEISANPHSKRDDKTAIPFNIEWNIDATDALNFVKSYGFGLITAINNETKDGIKDAITKYITGAFNIEQRNNAIATWLAGPGMDTTDSIIARAENIGHTESARAFNQGAVSRWAKAGVYTAKCFTVRDDKVCKLCRGLYGTVADVRVGWDIGGGRKTIPPFHPRCRDYMRPVMNAEPPPQQLPLPEPAPAVSPPPPKPDISKMTYKEVLAANRQELDAARGKIAEFTAKVKAIDDQHKPVTDKMHDLRVQEFDLQREIIKAHREGKPDAEIAQLDTRMAAIDKGIEDLRAKRDALDKQRTELFDTWGPTVRSNLRGNAPPAQFKIAVTRNMDASLKRTVGVAEAWLSDSLNGDKFGTFAPTAKTTANNRSYFDQGRSNQVFLRKTAGADIVTHELGHALEQKFPEIHKRCVEFLLARAQSTHIYSMNELAGVKGLYDRREGGLKDTFPDPYCGKWYPVLKSIDPTGVDATEILSMGLQYMMNDPVAFQAKDPEYYDFITAITRGMFS